MAAGETKSLLVEDLVKLLTAIDPSYAAKVNTGTPLAGPFNRIYLALARADDQREIPPRSRRR